MLSDKAGRKPFLLVAFIGGVGSAIAALIGLNKTALIISTVIRSVT
jgi:hypothetical protein